MFKYVVGLAVISAALLATGATGALASGEPGHCPSDSKLIGLIEISTDDRPDTWWGLTKSAMNDAGIFTDAGYLETIEELLGATFPNLDAAIEALVDSARPFDKNGNEWTCAYELRGTRTSLGDRPITVYGIGDDILNKKK
jgi:hypothetical protein